MLTRTKPKKTRFTLSAVLPIVLSLISLTSIGQTSPSVIDAEIVSEVYNGSNLDVSFATTGLNLPNGALDAATVNSSTVKLFNDGTNLEFTNTTVNTTGGGDAIVLTANGLAFGTTYRLEIGSGVEDITGASMQPFTKTFTTTADIPDPSGIEFTQSVVASGASYSCLAIGPDDKFYGLVNNGLIHRWDINIDGTLSNQQVINSLQTAEGGSRLAIHLAFDPSSTAQNLIAWVSHTTFGFGGEPDWEGKITRLSGANLQTVQDYVINLPRSAKDHVTNGLDFGPDGALYALQGSNSAMGEADGTWSFRPERLLTAAVLRIDLSAITSPPLDVQTEDGGTYDPFAPGAPVTIFASGTRNPYDLVWHSNGQLYVPTNGSAAGGNTPATPANLGDVPQRIDGAYTGGVVPAINGVSQTQNDFLFRCVEGGYYGHPNPTRGEYVLNGGNPTASSDPAQVNQYPVGTLPDPNYRGFAYNFLNNKSPNGVIEYTSNTFGGALAGKLMVVRYSGGDDIIVLTPGGVNQDIIDAETGIPGFTGFNNPLDLCENTSNGDIYVSEYGSGEITLLRPDASALSPVISADKSEVIFSGFVNPPGSLADDVQTLTLENIGVNDLTISTLNISGTDASGFSVVNAPSLPLILTSGGSSVIQIEFNPANTGALVASLDVGSDDANNPAFSIPLYGLASQQFEGSNEAPMSDIIATLGYNINIGWSGLTSNTSNFPLGDEVLESVFQKAGPGNVEVLPVARYSPAWPLPFGYYDDNDDTSMPTLNQILVLASGQGGTTNPDPEHQTLFPELESGSLSFDPGAGQFGFYTTSPSHSAYTEDALNALLHPAQAEHATRIYALKDRAGNDVPNTYLIGFEEASNGDYQDYVFVISNIQPASQAPEPGTDLVRLNVGGPEYTALNGNVFAADDPALITGATETSSKSFEILNSEDDDLYLLYRYGENFTYNIPVENGSYTVRLHFAEIFQTAVNQRVFSVDVEGGQGVLTDLDLFASAGFATALIEEFQNISVADGNMSITFSFSIDNALIQGIEIIGNGTGSNTPPTVSITAPADGTSINEGDEVTLTATASDAEDGDLTTSITWTSDLDGSLGTGGTIATSTLSLGTHVITAEVQDSETAVGQDQISLTVLQAPTGNVLYRETFWNQGGTGNEPLSQVGWTGLSTNSATPAGNFILSNSVGKPTGLPIVNAVEPDPNAAKELGFLAAFNESAPYFAFTGEYTLNLNNFNVSAVTWYQGHNNANLATRFAIEIDGQWFVTNQTFTNTAVASGGNFQNATGGAEEKTFTWSAAASDWLELNFIQGSSIAIGNPASADLSGEITSIGLYADGINGTFRADNLEIQGTPVGGNLPPVVENPIPDQSAETGSPFSFEIPANTFSDPDGSIVSPLVVLTTLPSWLTFDDQTNVFSGTPAVGDDGVVSIEVEATDDEGSTITDTFDLTVSEPAPNAPPIVQNPIADQSALVGSEFNFEIPANTFDDTDGSIVAPLVVLTTLPSWLSFDDQTNVFNGIPSIGDVGTITIDVQAADDEGDNVTDSFELTVSEPAPDCSPLSTLLCTEIPVVLSGDYCLNWDNDEGGLVDNAGFGIGFTMAMEPSSPLAADLPLDPIAPGYKPSLLNVIGGNLVISATQGIPFKDPTQSNNTNSLINGLAIGFEADQPEPYNIETVLTNVPAPGSAQFQQGGLWFGLDEATYVKLVIISNSGGSAYNVELLYEENEIVAGGDDPKTNNLPVAVGSDVVLRMEVDPVGQTVTGTFSTDGGVNFTTVGQVDVAAALFDGILLSDGLTGPVSFAGLHGSTRNSTTSLDFAFDSFCIDLAEPQPILAGLTGTIDLQGRTDETASLTLELWQAGSLVSSFNPSSNAAGEFVLNDLTPGTYDVAVRTNGYLQSVQSIPLVAGANSADFGILLGGDVDGNNKVELQDFALLAGVFNSSNVNPQDPNNFTDFNNSGLTDLADFAILAGNWQAEGDDPATP